MTKLERVTYRALTAARSRCANDLRVLHDARSYRSPLHIAATTTSDEHVVVLSFDEKTALVEYPPIGTVGRVSLRALRAASITTTL